MKALVTIEVPDDGKCLDCNFAVPGFHYDFMCEIYNRPLRKDGLALKKCRAAVQRYKEGVR